MTNPASLLSAARDPSIIDSTLGALSTYGDAILARPVLSGIGLLAVAAIMRAAWVLTREPIRTAAATVAAHEAAAAAVVAIHAPGELTPEARQDTGIAAREIAAATRKASPAAADREARHLLHKARAASRTAGAFSLFPLPEPDGGEPTRPSTFRA